MKKVFALILSLALLVSCAAALADASHTDEEVQQLAREIISDARKAAFYPGAYAPDGFQQFYVDFHVNAKKLRSPGITAADYDAIMELKAKRDALVQIVDDPTETVWYIWGDQMACEDMTNAEGWELSYDDEGFIPFLNPYLIADQSQAKGNIVIIAGGSNTHRTNQLEGYPIAEYFNAQGYNAFVLQRRVLPYANVDGTLDLVRSIRYIRYNAEALGIGATDKIATCGFSAGGGHIVDGLVNYYGDITPDVVYPDYVPDEVDKVNADYGVALLIYGARLDDLTVNPNLPAIFMVAGEEDPNYWVRTATMASALQHVTDAELFMVPHAPHGFGLGDGLENYMDAFAAAAQWPALATQFLNMEFGYEPAVTDCTP